MPCAGLRTSWHVRSLPMKIVPCVMTLCLMTKAFTVASNHWAYCHDTGQAINVGLWSYLGGDIIAPPAAVPALYVGFSILSLLILVGDLSLAIMMVPRSTMFVLPALIAFAFIAGGMEFILLLLWQLPHSQIRCEVGYTFCLACVATVMDIFAGVCGVIEFIQRKRLEASRRRVGNLRVRPPDTRVNDSDEEEAEVTIL